MEPINRERVVVPLDGSGRAEDALPYAVQLAQQLGATLSVVSVVDMLASLREQYLEEVAGRWGAAEVKVLSTDDPAAEAVARFVGTDGSSIPVLCSHGHRAATTVFLGSFGARLVRLLSPHPVVLVPRHTTPSGRLERLVVPLDGSRHAEAALPVAAGLAEALAAKVMLVQVVDPPSRRAVPHWEDNRTAAEGGYLCRTTHHPGLGPGVGWDVLHDHHPAVGIASYTEEMEGSAAVVMATHGHTGRALLGAGSVALDLIAQATCPVFLMRPAELEETSDSGT